jgi:hypothetical protein
MLKCTSRREPCSISTKTYNSRNVAVTAAKKSQATIAFAWWRSKVEQRGSPRECSGGRLGMHFLIVRGETCSPSFSSSSLAIGSSPQNGLSVAMRRMSWRSSSGIRGRACLDLERQNSLHPAQCQRINVSGRTTTRASRQSNCRERYAGDPRIAASTRLGFTPRSSYPASSRRRKRFSASMDRRGLTESASGATKSASDRKMT